MDARVEPAFEETKRLQRCINDLTSLLALPAIWSGRDPAGILRTLTDALFGMLHLDFVYGRFTDASGDAPIEMTRAQKSETQPEEFSQALRQWLKVEPAKWPRSMRDPAGEDDISILPLRLGLSGEFGMVVAGARRADFPRDTEKLILSVAANQASIGLQEAQRSREQKRLAVDLDRQVARRTKELAEANEALKREFGERARTEEILRRRELDFRLIVDSIPVPVAVTMPTGEVEGLNQPALDYFGKTPDELKQWSADVVHPDDLQRMIAAYRAAHETGHTYNVECRHRRADGAYRWFKVIGLPLRDPQGGILRWLHLQIDIEDRKRAEIHLAGEKQILEMIASGRPLRDVLETLCRFFEGAADDCFCGLSPIDSRSKTYQYGVAPSLPASYTDPVEGALVSTDDSRAAAQFKRRPR